MNLIINQWPSLIAAAKEIAYDNGMINRDHAEVDVITEMMSNAYHHFDARSMKEAEEQMAKHIAQGRLNEVCCGGDDRVTEISQLLDDVLNEMFEAS